MDRIAAGAEAVLYRDDDRIRKERVEKPYRHPELDTRLRGERTEQEAALLQRAREAGVKVPDMQEVDEYAITMDAVDGELLKTVFAERESLWPRIGAAVARLHNRNIIHGDLTTSNMIVVEDEPVFIDFGLGFFSQRVEDKATDLHLLKQVLDSTHTGVAAAAMQEIRAGYLEEAEDAAQILERFEDIAARGRYKS